MRRRVAEPMLELSGRGTAKVAGERDGSSRRKGTRKLLVALMEGSPVTLDSLVKLVTSGELSRAPEASQVPCLSSGVGAVATARQYATLGPKYLFASSGALTPRPVCSAVAFSRESLDDLLSERGLGTLVASGRALPCWRRRVALQNSSRPVQQWLPPLEARR